VTPRPRRRQIEELDALLEGRLGPEDASPASRRLASVATGVLERDPLPAVELGEDRKAALRSELLADIAATPAPAAERTRAARAPRTRRAATQARVAVASTVAAAMIGTTGIAVVAPEALPGDALYSIKKATESLRISLASDHATAGRLELRFAEERLAEVIAGSQDQRVASAADLIGALTEMDQRSLSGAELLVRLAERDDRPELLEELAGFTERQTAALTGAYAELPATVKPHAEDSLSVLRRLRAEVLSPAIERCDCLEPAGVGSPFPQGGDRDAESWFRSATLPLPPLGSADDGDGPSSTGALDPPGTSTLDVATSASSTDTPRPPRPPGRFGELGPPVDATASGTTGTAKKLVSDPVGAVEEAVEDPTRTVGKVAEGDVGGAVEGTSDDLTGTVHEVADGVGDMRDEVTDGVTDTLRIPPPPLTRPEQQVRGRPNAAP
jgi:hypothetical protein